MTIHVGPICFEGNSNSFWFRLFGHGFSVENRNVHLPSFSERNNIRKVLRLGKWAIWSLKP